MPKRLLLADDSKTIQTAVSMTFAREDVQLVAVEDGEAALQKAREQRPDLVLADVTMPKLGGYELCQRLRSDAALKDVPVLLLGGGAPIDPAKAMAVGANGHMPKPFDSTKLIDQVKQILANPRVPMSATPGATPSAAPPASRPPAPAAAAKPSSSPQRPPTAPPAARPAAPGAMPRPPASPVAARPSAPPAGSRPPVPQRPAGAPSAPPAAAGARPIARPPAPPVPAARPPTPGAAKPAPPARPLAQPLTKPPTGPLRPPPPPAARPQPPRPPPAPVLADDEDIPMDEDMDEAPTPLRSVSGTASAKPSLSVVPPPDGGEALLRDALSKASREVIEKIAWEVVPELAETIIREELERLLKERGA